MTFKRIASEKGRKEGWTQNKKKIRMEMEKKEVDEPFIDHQ